jgi:hypothetical protein
MYIPICFLIPLLFLAGIGCLVVAGWGLVLLGRLLAAREQARWQAAEDD